MVEVHCKYDELVDIEKIKLDPENRNIHTEEQIERLSKIIEYQGMRLPIIVSKKTGLVKAGEGRVLALKKLNEKKIPVVYQDFVSQDQEYSFGVSDNAIASWAELDFSAINNDLQELDGIDFDIDLLGIKDFTIEPLEKIKDEIEDEVPKAPAIPTLKEGDLIELGNHRLLCGDSTLKENVDKLMGGQKADMVFTDPPYGIGYEYNKHKDAQGKEYLDFCDKWFENIKNNKFIVITAGWKYNSYWIKKEPRDLMFWLQRNKQTGGTFFHFRRVEPIFVWGNPIRKYNFDFFEETSDRLDGLREKHTCPKPVNLIQEIISVCDKSVLDVFGGSGTTLIACEKTNRKCFMMELDPTYCDVIVTRWTKYAENNMIKINGNQVDWSKYVREKN